MNTDEYCFVVEIYTKPPESDDADIAGTLPELTGAAEAEGTGP